ncbi:DUF3850 domain-containing protein [Emticicia sp. C21]|uniref:DUF3850 domain-containing protein n=1 Tax=Emticicia sp. C21 TaxID=2302915 RepID=UPI000E351CF0|nr:DUF3850 domain-containing protein [Emticicia sp. C21]RFS16087.1 DUF3850 domain-containing protein [Emticicia sp. C21]
MKHHLFKLSTHDFEPFWTGKKRFEVIKDDRHFRVEDTVLFREVDIHGDRTGRYVKVVISYKLRMGSNGLAYEFCAIGFTQGITGYDCTNESPDSENDA